jgi:hypothetical protein
MNQESALRRSSVYITRINFQHELGLTLQVYRIGKRFENQENEDTVLGKTRYEAELIWCRNKAFARHTVYI